MNVLNQAYFNKSESVGFLEKKEGYVGFCLLGIAQ